MKKLLLLLAVVVVLVSCSLEEDKLKFHVEFLPVVPVELPEVMHRGQTYTIKVNYSRPNDCYYFDGFYHEMDGLKHVFAVQALVIQDASCEPLDTLTVEEASFDFTCPQNYGESNYFFKFYRGESVVGNSQEFVEYEIPVE